MSNSKNYIGNSDTAVYVLMPICVESKHDVFFNVLKNVVGRVGRIRLTEHYLDNAFKWGMTSDGILIDDVIVQDSWQTSDPKRSQSQQSQLLGLWSTSNCPTFGRVFFGDAWQAPNGNFATVKTEKGLKSMTAAEIDSIIFRKMKCHLVELNVCASTLANLKHFVKVPMSEIEVENGWSQLSPRMKSFDIKKDYLEKCWEALKRGVWLSSTQVNMNKKKLTPSQSVVQKRARLDSESVNLTYGNNSHLDLSSKVSSEKVLQSIAIGDAPINLSIGVDPLGQSIGDAPVDLSVSGDPAKEKERLHEMQPGPTTQELRERVYELESQLLVEVRKSVVTLQRELTQKNESLLEVEKRNRDLQLQLTKNNISLADLEKTRHDLQLELDNKNRSFTEIEKLNAILLSDSNQKEHSMAELEKANHRLQLQLNEFQNSTSVTESILNEKDTSLAQIKKLHRDLQLQLIEKNTSTAELEEANHTFKLELAEKTASLAEIRKSISVTESKLNEKESSLAQIEKSHRELQQQFNEKSESLDELTTVNLNLQLELANKNQLVANMEKLGADIEASILVVESELNEKKQTLSEITTVNLNLQLELGNKDQLLANMEKLGADIQASILIVESELNEKNKSLADITEVNHNLLFELGQKNQSIAELEKVNAENQASMLALQTELNKQSSLAEYTKMNPDFSNEKNVAEMQNVTAPHNQEILAELSANIPSTSVGETMSKEIIEQEQHVKIEAHLLDFWLNISFLCKPTKWLRQAQPKIQQMHVDLCVPIELLCGPFKTNDEIVKACRPKLMGLQFAWIKFSVTDKYRPGFIYPPDPDGMRRAQEVTSDGYVSDEKVTFESFENDIPEQKKAAAQIKKLKLLNKKFHFSLK